MQSAKLLIVTATNNLLWNEHINDVVKKASKRLYFLVQFSKKGKASLQRSSSFFLYLRPLSKHGVHAYDREPPALKRSRSPKAAKRSTPKLLKNSMSTLYPREIFMSEHALIDAFKRKERQWKRSFETSTSWQNTVRDEQIRDRIVTGILDKSLSQKPPREIGSN